MLMSNLKMHFYNINVRFLLKLWLVVGIFGSASDRILIGVGFKILFRSMVWVGFRQIF